MPEVQTSNDDPSLIALRIPKGIDTMYANKVDHNPNVIDTGIFSRIKSIIVIDLK